MSAQEIIQNTLSKAAGLTIQFHAYYWGKFGLVESSKLGEHTYFAEATSTALDRKLSFKGKSIYLHKDKEEPLFLTEDLQLFFQNATHLSQLKIYDARLSYTELFTPNQMYVSDFTDPESFEEVEAYLKFLKGIVFHFDSLLDIKEIYGKELEGQKRIYFTLHDSIHEIRLLKELFDMEFLEALNDILTNQHHTKESLYLSIDSKMRMVILKLDSASFEKATRMGLIV